MSNKFKYSGESCFLPVVVLLCILFNSAAVHAQMWNPFAPKNYEECLLKNVKDGMGDAAVRAVAVACRNQFSATNNNNRNLEIDARWDKCGLEKTPSGETRWVDIEFLSKRGSGLMNNLTERSWDFREKKVSFQNKNNFGISYLKIGFTNSKSCLEKAEDYRFTIDCGIGRYTGVNGHAYGSLNCGAVPDAARNMGYCFIGFVPQINSSPEFWIDFVEENGFCKK